MRLQTPLRDSALVPTVGVVPPPSLRVAWVTEEEPDLGMSHG